VNNGLVPRWQEYLDLGEELLRLPDTRSLVNRLQNVITDHLHCEAKLWLCEPFYPLPGEPHVETIPSPEVDLIIESASNSKTRIVTSGFPKKKREPIYTITLPVTTRGNTLGILKLQRDPSNPFNDDEIEYVEGLTAFTAVSMQVNRQVTLKNWRYDQISLVRSVSSQIANELNLDELCKKVTNLIQCSFDYYHVAVYTLEDSSNQLRFRASSLNCSPTNDNPFFSVTFGEGLIGEVAKTGVEIVCKDVSKEPRFRYLDSLPLTKSEAVLPLLIENRILGVLDIQSNSPNAFHENDMLVIRSLADNIGLAVEGARLYNDLEKHADQLSAVAEINFALSSILDLDGLLQEVVSVIHERFKIPFVSLFTVHPGRKKVIFQTGFGKRSQNLKSKAFAFDLDSNRGIIPQVARSGNSILANDVTQEPLYTPSKLSPAATKSEMTIPLKFGEEVVGVLDLQSDKLHAFGSNDLSLFEGLASGIALSMRNATLFRTERWRRKVADSFKDVAGLLSSNLALDELLENILIELESSLPCDASAIWLLDNESNESGGDSGKQALRLAAVRGTSRLKVLGSVDESKAVRKFLEYAIEKNEPVIRKPNDPYGPLGVACNFKPKYSSIAVPLLSSNEVIGVLTLAHQAEGRYGSEASDIASTFASYAAVAIENARLYTNAQEDAWSSTVLLQVAESMQSITNTDELLATIVRLTPLLVGINQCAFYMYDSIQKSYVLQKWYGFTPADDEKVLKDEESIGMLKLHATLRPVFIKDLQKELSINSFSIDETSGTLVLIPLVSHGELLGAFLVSHSSSGEFGVRNKFTGQTLAILSGIAQQTSVTLENIHLIENRQEEAYITAVLLQVAQAVVTQNNLQDILQTIVYLLSILVGLDTSIISIWDPKKSMHTITNVTSSSHIETDAILGKTFQSGEFPILDRVVTEDQMFACPLADLESNLDSWKKLECNSLTDFGQSQQVNWLLGFPLSIKGEVYGVLLAKEKNIQPLFHSKRLELIKGVAQQTTMAIQNERLKEEMVDRERMEREFQLARDIQKTFLPEIMPNFEGWDIDLRWHTAREVGGDFYDVFETRNHHIALVIADVADKGMPAALYMTVTRTLIRAAAQTLSSPGKILERVNELLEMESRNGMFVTALVAILDPKTGILNYANAGHNLPLWVKSDPRDVVQLEKDGIALAVVSDATYKDKQIQLSRNDSLLLYTDGVTEATNPDNELFSEPRLIEILTTGLNSSSDKILNMVEESIIEFRKGEPSSDDLTMICIHRLN
jgi:sigma-B regulation protein RsbU (phosphoserine phosphatase)